MQPPPTPRIAPLGLSQANISPTNANDMTRAHVDNSPTQMTNSGFLQQLDNSTRVAGFVRPAVAAPMGGFQNNFGNNNVMNPVNNNPMMQSTMVEQNARKSLLDIVKTVPKLAVMSNLQKRYYSKLTQDQLDLYRRVEPQSRFDAPPEPITVSWSAVKAQQLVQTSYPLPYYQPLSNLQTNIWGQPTTTTQTNTAFSAAVQQKQTATSAPPVQTTPKVQLFSPRQSVIVSQFMSTVVQKPVHPMSQLSEMLNSNPPKEVLMQLQPSQLCQIHDFTVYNKFGSITFMDPVDLNALSVKSLNISYGQFEVKEAFKRYQVQLRGIQGDLDLLKKQCESRGMRFVWFQEEDGVLVMET
ncbi:Nucleoporin_autopeptidase domain-containing protein [Hexamita inflata]|uniref:Nucleoporin autopeptidase domain-containing protein n=1 Tax=Hexamita inflata TaxID=28002 RepID=A0AA86Q8F3_9EUKA|nr:Nucleoporin autopeptidase domain-containing protein [Hexamita inflata]